MGMKISWGGRFELGGFFSFSFLLFCVCIDSLFFSLHRTVQVRTQIIIMAIICE